MSRYRSLPVLNHPAVPQVSDGPITRPTQAESTARATRWARRIGVAGFLFFFFKGLAWLIVPAVIYWFTKA